MKKVLNVVNNDITSFCFKLQSLIVLTIITVRKDTLYLFKKR